MYLQLMWRILSSNSFQILISSVVTMPSYTVRIPTPSAAEIANLWQVGQFNTPYSGLLNVYWINSTKQVLLHMGSSWYIQDDGYITDSLADMLNVRKSILEVENMRVGVNIPDMFDYNVPADDEMYRQIHKCTWSDYTCDFMTICADLYFPIDCDS